MYCGALVAITLFGLSALIAFNVGLLNCYQKVCMYCIVAVVGPDLIKNMEDAALVRWLC